jgi:hypothetical protein
MAQVIADHLHHHLLTHLSDLLQVTSELPGSIGSGDVITLSWTGGGGLYHIQMDSSNTGSQYSVSPSSSLGDMY